MTTHEERQRLAGMANALRPDWPTKSLYTLLTHETVVNRAYRDVALALTWISTDPTTRTPARLHEPGPWWNTTPAATPANRPTPGHPRPCQQCHWPHPPDQPCEQPDDTEHRRSPQRQALRDAARDAARTTPGR